MFWEESFGMQLEKFLSKDQFIFSAPMSEHTTFKIGGVADVLAAQVKARALVTFRPKLWRAARLL